AAPSRRSFLAWTGVAGAAAAVGAVATGTGVDADAAPAAAARTTAALPDFTPLRAPAVPLAVRSPYLSTWLAADNLAGTWPTFWTGRITAMSGIARVDGTSYVFLGNPLIGGRNPFPTMRQTSAAVTATRSTFVLEQGGVELTVVFHSPVEPGDLRRQSMPLSYITATARSNDGRAHQVGLYFDISGEWSYGDTDAKITWDTATTSTANGTLRSLTSTPDTPKVLAEENDTASWGTVVWSAVQRKGVSWQIGQDAVVRAQAVDNGVLSNSVDPDKPRAISDRWPVFAFYADLGTVRGATDPFTVSIGHIRNPAVSYLGTDLAPLWTTYYDSWQAMAAFFHDDHDAAVRGAKKLDAKISRDATRVGGAKYAALCDLAFRQAYAGTELVVRDGKPWALLKEISSDGNVSTVDVTYPAVPVWLYADPAYLGLVLAPQLAFAETGGWNEQYAEHDLGASYPNASGSAPGNTEPMPVEETANMLIMSAAYADRLSAKDALSFATTHYAQLKKWADYLVGNALDPGFQNQTDDFTGFIGHSVNLALKGIVGIAAMGKLAAAAANHADEKSYRSTAQSYIAQWRTKATDTDGDHLKLAYDQPGTWSLKYNGYADTLLGTGLVPAAVASREAAWYLTRANTYGVPLDLRHTYTKADWEMWTAAWLHDHDDIRDLLIESTYVYANTTPTRVPLSDWYDTTTAKQSGFQDRPVVGGLFALLTVGR
ncbi:glutaminase domain-containing protein, partial [uncultured Jatrophihabitans sp.]|uniref:glutaminase family protein n=1 Tax=uncultured Jatrophihabitans sp. TaxID=1610747 RepID=UPI0035CB0588